MVLPSPYNLILKASGLTPQIFAPTFFLIYAYFKVKGNLLPFHFALDILESKKWREKISGKILPRLKE
jgi:hypothetical protein